MRLLLVEDEADLAAELTRALSEEGFEVDHRDDGSEALDRALSEPYDLVVLDLMLPGLDGRSFLQHLRPISQVPVVILSARDGLSDRVGLLDDGADDYVTKPFELPELIARLRAAVRRRVNAERSVLRFGQLSIDLSSRSVLLADQEIALSPQEYRILESLALHPGQPVSKRDLWDRLCGSDEEFRSNVVAVYIHRLRAKLGSERIQTRAGFGYVLTAP